MMRSMLVRCQYCQINRVNAFLSSKRCIVASTQQYAKTVAIHSNITVHDLASKLKKKSKTILELLDEYGYVVDHGINTALDIDIAGAIADEFGYKVTNEKEKKEEKYHEDAGVSLPRPPVITIMGHVDHGKTTLLDYLRKTQVAENEAGGITQAISAFSVKVPGLSDSITFVDTPGHAAFNNMRARGAQTTDAVVLIIAADDGIMEQTVECIKHIKKADVPLIVAFNKMDKPKANTDKIKKDLLTHGLQLKEQGGDIDCVEISALKGNNVDELLVLLNGLSKKHTFKASYDGPAQIVVLETENSKQKGMTSMVLVKHGQLSKGKVLMTDDGFIKIRQLLNPYGQSVEKANPSDPVTLMGWRSMPNPGDVAIEVKNEAEARNILKVQSQREKPEKVISNKPPVKSAGKKQLTQEMKGGRNKRIPLRVSLRAEAATGKVQQEEKSKTIDLIIKADVSGSLEAIVNILSRYHSTDITLNVLHASVGSVNENDLKMLQTSEDSIVYAFNVDVTKNLMTQAEKLDVPVKQFDIIYKLLDDLKEKLENTLPMRSEEHIIGEAEVLKVFKLTGSRKNVAAGCRVKEGFLDNSNSEHLWKVIRDHQPVYEAGIKSLKRGKEDIVLAKKMTECGVTLDNFEDYREGDKILCVRVDRIKQVVDWKL